MQSSFFSPFSIRIFILLEIKLLGISMRTVFFVASPHSFLPFVEFNFLGEIWEKILLYLRKFGENSI